jgi:hypothetical protein
MEDAAMTALDFPASPTVGQVFGRWTWDGTAWLLDGGGGGGGGVPTGTFIQGGWTTDPPGYLLMGQTVANGVAAYPALAAMFPAWVSGANLVLPSMDNRVLLGSASTPGAQAGSNTHTLLNANLPPHAHVADPPGTSVQWAGSGTNSAAVLASTPGVPNLWIVNNQPNTLAASEVGGVVDIPPFWTDNGTGTSTPVNHTPAHLTVRTAVKT